MGINISVTPIQNRAIDPYDEIITQNDINKELSYIVGTNKGIIDGLTVSNSNSQSIRIESGSCVIDKVIIDFPLMNININDLSTTNGTINVLYAYFKYELKTPLNNAIIDSAKADTFVPDDNNLVLAFITIDSSGNIVTIDNNSAIGIPYTTDRPSPVANMITELIHEGWKLKPNSDFDMKYHKIKNLANPEENTDMATKQYVDQKISSVNIHDWFVKVDANEENIPDNNFDNPGPGWFLDDQIKCDITDFNKPYGTSKTIATDGSGAKSLIISTTSMHCKITSGDSKGIFGGNK